MGNEKVIECIKACAGQYRMLADHKDDCDTEIAANIDLLVAEEDKLITTETKASIKKIAKAIADDKLKKLTDDIENMIDLITEIRGDSDDTEASV